MFDFIISEISDRNASASDDFSTYISDSWSYVVKLCYNETVEHALFTYTIIKDKDGEHCPVTQKSVTIDVNGILKYFVYGHHVQNEELEQVLKKKEIILNILRIFQAMKIYSG